MKKIKIFAVTVLSLLLCFLCITTTSFSWFDRPKTQQGSSLQWDIEYDTSVGNDVQMVTFSSKDGGKTYDEANPVTSFSNTLSGNSRICYRTDISNSSNAAQSVSLYLSSLTVDDNLFVGVNSPLKTYKNYSEKSRSVKIAQEINLQNVYLGLMTDYSQADVLAKTVDFIHSWGGAGGDSDCPWSNAIETGGVGSWSLGNNYWNGDTKSFKIYAMPIDYRSTQMQFVKKDNNYYQDPKPIIADNNTIVYFINNDNYTAQAKQSGTAAGLESFYSSATVAAGGRVDLKARGKANISYKSSDEAVATVDSNGIVTAKKSGKATITATSTGTYKDKISASCELTVNEGSNIKRDIPIAANIKLAAPANGDISKTSVYWYINNESEAEISYTVEDLYLTV